MSKNLVKKVAVASLAALVSVPNIINPTYASIESDRASKGIGQIRDLIEDEPTEDGKKCLITVLFDALMVEKIKSYSLNFDALAILSADLHDEYLRESVYDDGEF